MINEIINNLTDSQRDMLFLALMQGISQRVNLPNNKFIGVNIIPMQGIVILEHEGVWSYGEIQVINT